MWATRSAPPQVIFKVVKMYSKDLDSFKLKGQLLLLPQTAKSIGFDNSEFDINDLITLLQSLDSSHRKLLSKISTLRKLLLVMPTTNAVSERSFSALKWVKTYLRSTTGDPRLNHLMMLHVHKDRTDALTLVDIANDFVGEKESNCLANFPQTISQTSSLFCQSQHKWKIRHKTRGVVHNCSDLTCTKKYVPRDRSRGGGREINVGYLLSPPPSHFLLATGLTRQFTTG